MKELFFQIGLSRLASHASFGWCAPASPVTRGQGFAPTPPNGAPTPFVLTWQIE
jgi:hypothetical protein